MPHRLVDVELLVLAQHVGARGPVHVLHDDVVALASPDPGPSRTPARCSGAGASRRRGPRAGSGRRSPRRPPGARPAASPPPAAPARCRFAMKTVDIPPAPRRRSIRSGPRPPWAGSLAFSFVCFSASGRSAAVAVAGGTAPPLLPLPSSGSGSVSAWSWSRWGVVVVSVVSAAWSRWRRLRGVVCVSVARRLQVVALALDQAPEVVEALLERVADVGVHSLGSESRIS